MPSEGARNSLRSRRAEAPRMLCSFTAMRVATSLRSASACWRKSARAWVRSACAWLMDAEARAAAWRAADRRPWISTTSRWAERRSVWGTMFLAASGRSMSTCSRARRRLLSRLEAVACASDRSRRRCSTAEASDDSRARAVSRRACARRASSAQGVPGSQPMALPEASESRRLARAARRSFSVWSSPSCEALCESSRRTSRSPFLTLWPLRTRISDTTEGSAGWTSWALLEGMTLPVPRVIWSTWAKAAQTNRTAMPTAAVTIRRCAALIVFQRWKTVIGLAPKSRRSARQARPARRGCRGRMRWRRPGPEWSGARPWSCRYARRHRPWHGDRSHRG